MQSPIFQVILDFFFCQGDNYFVHSFICWWTLCYCPLWSRGNYCKVIWPPDMQSSVLLHLHFFYSSLPVGTVSVYILWTAVGCWQHTHCVCFYLIFSYLCCGWMNLSLSPPKFMCWRPQLQCDGSLEMGCRSHLSGPTWKKLIHDSSPLLTSCLLGLQAIAPRLFFETYNCCSFIYNIWLQGNPIKFQNSLTITTHFDIFSI